MNPELARTEGKGREGKGRARPSETFLPGFESRDIEASGARIHLASGGGGPPLVRLHGHAQTHLSWHKITPRLAGRFSVVAPGLHGYGNSAKPEGGEGYMNDSKHVWRPIRSRSCARLGSTASPWSRVTAATVSRTGRPSTTQT
jgi:pimeloyl-ACP methyl ester carboxylesterase